MDTILSKVNEVNVNTSQNYIKEQDKLQEIGGPKGLEPTRYGIDTPEWEVKGRVSDF